MVRKAAMAANEQKSLDQVLTKFKEGRWDSERHVAELEKLKASVTRTSLYLPAVTKGDMDRAFGRPVTAIVTVTETNECRIYFHAVDSAVKGHRKVSTTKTMGVGRVGLGVPLRKLKIRVPEGRRVELDVDYADAPDLGRIYWIDFSDFENKPQQVDEEIAQAKKLVEDEQKKARKAERIEKILAKRPAAEAR